MSASGTSPRGRNLLSLDGGGIRGVVELIILDDLMVTVQNLYNLQELPRPCECFDLIGGTSTGGLNALLLGRLGMSTQEALNIYPGFSKTVFGTPKSKLRLPFFGGRYTAYSAATMEKELKKIILNRVKGVEGNKGEDEPMLDEREDTCKTLVLAVTADKADDKSGPRLIRSYTPRVGRHFNPTLWEAGRATSATPGFFKEIEIGPPGFSECFIDGGLGGNNPIKQVISEASEVYGPDEMISCIVSIGAGILKHVRYTPGFIPDSIVKTLIKISTNCERTQQEIAVQFQNVEHIYFRFNVEQGLQEVALDDWNRLGEVKTHTASYLAEPKVKQKIEQVARLLHTRPAQFPFGSLRPTERIDALLKENPRPVSRALRPPPAHFYGRTEYVDNVVRTIAAAPNTGRGAHLCIRGYGGIGKTSVALAVCHHPSIASIFGERRFFVSCESAGSASLLLQSIASQLQIDVSKGDPLALVESGLIDLSRIGSLLLVLDNAETFLHSERDATEDVDEILLRVSSITRLTLILTKRGLEQPFRVKWDPLEELGTLSLEAARESFISITQSEEHASSPLLDGMLTELDCVPLAVALCAQVVHAGGESLETFCRRWNNKKTDLLKLGRMGGDSKETSVQISIETSLQSPLLVDDNYAKRLLSIISHLPDGIYSPHIERLSENWQTDVSDAEHTIKRLSLAHRSPDSQFLTTLSPIRQHIRKHYPVLEDDFSSVLHWHLELSGMGDSSPGDAGFLTIQRELTANRGNISIVLHRSLEGHNASQDILEAVLQFSTFLYWSFPDGELLKLAPYSTSAREPNTRGKLLSKLGNILRLQNRNDEARDALKEAQAEFRAIGDRQGAAQSLGNILRMQGRNDESSAVLEEARGELQVTGDRLGAAQCLRSIGNILRIQNRNDEAKSALEKARGEFQAIGNRVGVAQCLRSLGNISRIQRRHEEARATLEEAQSEFQAIGDRLGAAQCLQSLGDILRVQNRNDEARTALEQARAQLQVIGNRLGAAQCLQSLGDILQAQNRHEEARVTLEEARGEFQVIENRLGVTQCLRGLGNILFILGRYEEARAALEEVQVNFQAMGDRQGAADCVWKLGEISRSQGNIRGARVNFEEARKEFELIGNPSGLAWCLYSLGKVEIEDSKLDDAKATFRDAAARFHSIGDSDGLDACQKALDEITETMTSSNEGERDHDLTGTDDSIA